MLIYNATLVSFSKILADSIPKKQIKYKIQTSYRFDQTNDLKEICSKKLKKNILVYLVDKEDNELIKNKHFIYENDIAIYTIINPRDRLTSHIKRRMVWLNNFIDVNLETTTNGEYIINHILYDNFEEFFELHNTQFIQKKDIFNNTVKYFNIAPKTLNKFKFDKVFNKDILKNPNFKSYVNAESNKFYNIIRKDIIERYNYINKKLVNKFGTEKQLDFLDEI